MSSLVIPVRDVLLRHPDIHIVSDGQDFGTAADFLSSMEPSALSHIEEGAIGKAIHRLAGIAAVGLNLRFLDGRDIAQFDRIIETYCTLTTPSQCSLTENDFEFFSAYQELFDEDYYIAGATSAYKRYGWTYYDPAITVPRVEAIIEATDLRPKSKVLDFGCAVGFFVHSFLQRGFETKGVDISRYAIGNAHPDVQDHLLPLTQSSLLQLKRETFDLILVKDVLEHVPEPILPRLWAVLTDMGKKLVVTVPIANHTGEYINPVDEQDLTHVVRKDADWWLNRLGATRRDDHLCTILKGQEKSKGTLCAMVTR